MKQNVAHKLFFQKIIQMEFPKTGCRKQQRKRVWSYLHYNIMWVRSDTNICLSSINTSRCLTITGDN